jgi:hypothetical protein
VFVREETHRERGTMIENTRIKKENSWESSKLWSREGPKSNIGAKEGRRLDACWK